MAYVDLVLSYIIVTLVVFSVTLWFYCYLSVPDDDLYTSKTMTVVGLAVYGFWLFVAWRLYSCPLAYAVYV